MKPFLLALKFLTAFPYPRDLPVESGDAGRSMGYYSLIGALLGLVLYLADWLLRGHLLFDLIDLLLLILLASLTRGLHLDGLADTLDGLGGGQNREERLSIMRDSRLGTFGVLGLIFLVLVEMIALRSLGDLRGRLLILAPLLSRCSMVVLALTQPYARRQEGLGRAFVEEVGPVELLLSGGIALFACLVLLWTKGLILLCLIGIFTLLMGRYFRRRLGGITGDTLGAHNELVTALVWVFGCLW